VRPLFRQRIDHPISVARCYNHSPVSKVAKVLRDFHLWLAKNILEMTDTERRFCEKMENPQPCAIAKTFVDLDQLHIALTTSRGRGATVDRCFGLTTLARPTLRPAALQDQVQALAIRCYFGNWILRYDTAIVFDLYIQICTRNDAISESQNLRKAVRSKPVISIIADVRLQHDLFFFSG
jgi:hypothetical protein